MKHSISPFMSLPLAMSGTSYNQVYSLPPHYQPFPSFYRPYPLNSFTANPQNQFTSVNFLPNSQSQSTYANLVQPTLRRKRASRPKVRSGCSTCKVCLAFVFFCIIAVSRLGTSLCQITTDRPHRCLSDAWRTRSKAH